MAQVIEIKIQSCPVCHLPTMDVDEAMRMHATLDILHITPGSVGPLPLPQRLREPHRHIPLM